jgi:signal transduction histidine kinase
VANLRSPMLARAPLPEALSAALHRSAAGAGVDGRFVTEGEPCPLPPDVESQVLRIAQEAVANAVKHARAGQIAMTLAFAPGELRLEVADDGIGFDPVAAARPSADRFGLAGMHERADRLGGTLAVDSEPGRGARVRLVVPLPGARPAGGA